LFPRSVSAEGRREEGESFYGMWPAAKKVRIGTALYFTGIFRDGRVQGGWKGSRWEDGFGN
jgi:hypothetical protein